MNRFLNFISTPSGRFDLTDFYFETIDDDKQRKDYHAFSKMLTKNCCCIKKKKKNANRGIVQYLRFQYLNVSPNGSWRFLKLKALDLKCSAEYRSLFQKVRSKMPNLEWLLVTLCFASAKHAQMLFVRSCCYLREWSDRCTFTNLPVNHWDILLQQWWLVCYASSYFTSFLPVFWANWYRKK